MTEPLLLSVREAARRLGIGRDTTYALIREGRLRSLAVNRRILVPVAELQRFVEREAERDGVSIDDELLDRVREYRRAARMAVRADKHPFQTRCLCLIDLAEAARAEPDPVVRTWSERAIWEESKGFLGMDDEEHSFPPEPFEAAQRRLRAEGYSACPKCLSVLATAIDFERWHQQRADHEAELRRREEALG